jgi:hypothetical protein
MVPTIEGSSPRRAAEPRGEERATRRSRVARLVMDELNLDCCIVLSSLVCVDCLSD